MLFSKHQGRRSDSGFSLVEILIGSVVGMLGIVVIMQVFLVSEGQKRTTTGGADAQENGLMALFTMEQDMRMAGLGLVGTGCAVVSTWDDLTAVVVSRPMWPTTITRPNPDPGTDQVSIMYSTSSFANVPTILTVAMPATSSIVNILNGAGFQDGDLFVVSQPPSECTRAEATQDGQRTGTTWDLQHNPAARYNPPGAWARFPAGGYGPGARVTNMGQMVDRTYLVQDGNLVVRDNNQPIVLGANPLVLVNGIVAIRAQYGRDYVIPPATVPDGFVDSYDNNATAPTSLSPAAEIASRQTEVVSIKLAVVARSGQQERENVSPDKLVLWSGGTLADGGSLEAPIMLDRTYRYKVYQTIIPLRNVVWNTP